MAAPTPPTNPLLREIISDSQIKLDNPFRLLYTVYSEWRRIKEAEKSAEVDTGGTR